MNMNKKTLLVTILVLLFSLAVIGCDEDVNTLADGDSDQELSETLDGDVDTDIESDRADWTPEHIKDCEGRICGLTRSREYSCGTCSNSEDYCNIYGNCENACKGRECGMSPYNDMDCGACSGATDHCNVYGKCVNDCDGRVCGLSPYEKHDCGNCQGATDFCDVLGQCSDDCEGMICGQSENDLYSCGSCTDSKLCAVNRDQCVDTPCDSNPCNSHGTCNVIDDYAVCTCDNEYMTLDCGKCTFDNSDYPNCKKSPVWIDPDTGLMWQNSSISKSMWGYGCENKTLAGHSDWRFPTISELRSLIRGCPNTETGGACKATDSCESSLCWDQETCGRCPLDQGLADGCYWPNNLEGPCEYYWSATYLSCSYHCDDAWLVNFRHGGVNYQFYEENEYLRCVR